MLIAGERRLAACAFLLWREVPVTVVDLDKVVKGEFAENSERKDLTLSEAVAIKRAIEPIERAEADPELAAKGEELLRSQCSTPTSLYVRKVTA